MSDEAFLSRWSRLKRKAATAEPERAPAEPFRPSAVPAAAVTAAPVPARAESPGDAQSAPVDAGNAPVSNQEPGDSKPLAPDVLAPDPLEDLPPIDELTGESDFTPFLRAEVPEDLHRRALRKLWMSDPVYANDDGLKDYADDYAALFSGNDPVKTLYRVGKGFLDDLDEVAEAPAEPVGEGEPPEPSALASGVPAAPGEDGGAREGGPEEGAAGMTDPVAGAVRRDGA